MYYFLMALVDIFFFITENWKELTATAIASGVGIILGKRLGSRIVVKQFMKALGLEKKSKLERKVEWLLEIEGRRGNTWPGNTATSSNMDRMNLKRLFSLLHMATSREGIRTMKDFLTGKKKWIAFLVAVILNGLNDVLGLGMDADTIANITTGATGYIVVEGVLDFTRALTNHFKSKGEKKDAQSDIPVEPTL